jgi:uncharacterized peroxidase-related enzyme
MKTIQVPTSAQLSDTSKHILEQVEKKLGKVPNLYATIGYSPAALKAMLDTEAGLSHDAIFSAKDREAINLIVSQVNNCEYCLAAHTLLGKMKGYTEAETLAIRKGTVNDAKLQTAVQLAASIANNKGAAEPALLDAFFAAGYDEAALIELTALIALRSFTNYVYANTKITVDFPPAPQL